MAGAIHLGGNGQGMKLVAAPPEQQLLEVMRGTLDAMLQLQCRIAVGWDPKEAVKDMGLNVPLPPVKLENQE